MFLSTDEKDVSPEEAAGTTTASNRFSALTNLVPDVRTLLPIGGGTTQSLAKPEEAQRNRRLRLAICSSFLTKPLAVVIPLVTVPLFLKYLGKERYGLYETIISLAGWLSLTNLGLGLGLMNKLTECYVSQDRALARRHVSTLFCATAMLMLVFALGLLAVVPFVDWNSFFRTTMAQGEVAKAIALACVLSLATVFANILSPIYSAYQELDRFNYWDGASKIFTLISCFILAQTQLGLLGVLLAMLGAPVIVRLANLVFLFAYEKPWLCPKTRLFEWGLLKPMMAEGLCFFLLQMAGVALFSTDKLIISTCLGPAAVTDYAVVSRIFLMGYGIYLLFLMPMWPAYGEALRRNDLDWVKKHLRLSLWLGCGGVALLGMLLLWQGKALLNLWVGPTVLPAGLVVGLSLSFLFKAWVDCRSVVLNAAGYLKGQIYFWTIQAVLNLVLAVTLVRSYGVLGVAWAGPISSVLTSFWGYPLMMKRLLKNSKFTQLTLEQPN